MTINKKTSKLEEHRAAIKTAMPQVEALVREHSLSIVHSCITKLYEKRKLRKKADDLRKEIAELEQKIK